MAETKLGGHYNTQLQKYETKHNEHKDKDQMESNGFENLLNQLQET